VGGALGHLSLLKHYNNLVQGIFDTSSLILFASYIVLVSFSPLNQLMLCASSVHDYFGAWILDEI